MTPEERLARAKKAAKAAAEQRTAKRLARDGLKLMDDGRSTNIILRGVPREVFNSRGLTPPGFGTFREFNRAAGECGCVIVRAGEICPVTKLEPSHHTLFSYKKGKRATLRKLVSILGDDAAQQFWDDLKAREKRPATTPS